MPRGFKNAVLSLFVPAIILFITACPGLVLENISISYGANGAIVGATGTFSCISPVTQNALLYTWHFGDGTTAQGQTVTHIFNEVGDFLVECHIATPTSLIIYSRTITIGSTIQNIAWTNNGTNTILTCPADGPTPCSPTILADAGTSGVDEARGLVIIEETLYWANTIEDTIRSCSITTTPCTSTIIADNGDSGVDAPVGIFVDGNRIYWANTGDQTVRSCAIGATPCTSVTVHADQPNSNINGIATDVFVLDGYVYWSQSTLDSIRRCLITAAICVDGSDVEVIANDVVTDSPRSLFIADGFVYYSSADDDEVRACPIPGLCPIDFTSTIFMDAGNSGLVFPNGLFIDQIADHLYLSDSSNRIMRCPISATTPCGTVASELTIFANAATSGLNSPQFVWGY